jgi:predicted TIM-barrel fold metal-dependent hydrolase
MVPQEMFLDFLQMLCVDYLRIAHHRHTGGAPSVALRWENSRPAYFASVAARYPEVNFIFAHCGDVDWWQEAM